MYIRLIGVHFMLWSIQVIVTSWPKLSYILHNKITVFIVYKLSLDYNPRMSIDCRKLFRHSSRVALYSSQERLGLGFVLGSKVRA